MTDPTVPHFNPGGIVDRVDHRDHLYSEVGFGTAPFDWNTGFDIEQGINFKLPVKDQNGSYSCGGQAWATLAGVLEAKATGSFEERSAKFVYAQTYQWGGGSTARDNANIFIKQGVARESVLSSYDHGAPPAEAYMTRSGDIGEVARNDAKLSLSSSYAAVTTTIDEVARALRDNHGVILGIDGENNGTWSSAFPKPPTHTEWRHWIYAGKAKKLGGVKYLGLLNSWGTAVGESGWQWIPESYFTSGHIFSAWTHVLNPTPPDPSFHYAFIVNLQFGQSGVDIVNLQKALQIDGEFPLNVPCTGFYGDVTRRAVLAFRLKYKVSSTTDPEGRAVGPLTRAQLNKLFV